MDAARLARAAARRVQAAVRRARDARSDIPVERQDVELTSSAGYRIAARVTRPAGGGEELPALVISPAIHEGRVALEGFDGPVAAGEIARHGYAVVTFDPAGRGESWGAEDFGGPEHQDDLRVVIRWAREHHPWVGVLSLSLGLAAAAGALAKWRDELDVRWLVDWEGPCDREIVTAGGTRMEPADGHDLLDDAYWAPREATRHVGKLRCAYVRLQADPDHAQPGEVRHATRMLHAAADGGLPWFQINDHPRGDVPPRPVWLRGGTWAANRAILRKLAALR